MMTTDHEAELMKQSDKLKILAIESAEDGHIFTTAYAVQALATVHSKTLGMTVVEGERAVEDMWRSYFAIRKMFSLHVEQAWNAHYRELRFWQKRRAKRERGQWMRNHRTKLENRAERDVDNILSGRC